MVAKRTECETEGCNRKAIASGRCRMCYDRIARTGTTVLTMPQRNPHLKQRLCQVPNCEDLIHAKGMCRRHYGQIWRKGFTYDTRMDRPNRKGEIENAEIVSTKLERAKDAYRCAVGLSARMFWRRQLEVLEAKAGALEERARMNEVPVQ